MENYFDASSYEPLSPTPPQKPEKKSRGIGKIIALALACSLFGSALGAGGFWLLSRQTQPAQSQSSLAGIVEGNRKQSQIEITSVDTSQTMTPAEVYKANVNSTVGITTSVVTNFWGYQTTTPASGSGFIYSDNGYILTNYHVVEDSDSISVALYDGTTYPATLVGYDESNDIAVLKVDAAGLVPVVLGDSDNLYVGDSVLAIGNPLGELTFSLTAGTVSALDRDVTFSNGVTMKLLQTDCAINSGNSGGALFNLHGEVIGITNAKYSSGSGASIDNIGFAIPINQVRGIVDSIITKGYVSKPYLGVQVSTVSQQLQLYGLPQGASVETIVAGSPAEAAGLQTNDIITAVNGQAITESTQLVELVQTCTIGQKLTLSIYRQGQTLELTLTVGEYVQPALEQTEPTTPSRQPGFESFWDMFGQ